MSALDRLIDACQAAAEDAGPGAESSLIEAARAEQAELVAALRTIGEHMRETYGIDAPDMSISPASPASPGECKSGKWHPDARLNGRPVNDAMQVQVLSLTASPASRPDSATIAVSVAWLLAPMGRDRTRQTPLPVTWSESEALDRSR